MRQSRFDAGANGTCGGNLGGARCTLDPPVRKAVASAIFRPARFYTGAARHLVLLDVGGISRVIPYIHCIEEEEKEQAASRRAAGIDRLTSLQQSGLWAYEIGK